MHLYVAGQEPIRVGLVEFEKFRFAIANAFGVSGLYFKRYEMCVRWCNKEQSHWDEIINPIVSHFMFCTPRGGLIAPEDCRILAQELANIQVDAMNEYAELMFGFLRLLNAAVETDTILYWS